jgi:two-component system, chemotaxis family, CheB/CheR fusion protein
VGRWVSQVNDTSHSSHAPLVVVGASAGGIEALSVLVSTLPTDFPAPLVVAQHLDPAQRSHLEEILSRRSKLPVRTVTDHEALEPGVVFVVPANRNVRITDSEIEVTEGPRQPKPSVDLLLESAAEAVGENLIAVILTGTGSDGAAGANAVKKAGGTVIIQDPKTAQYPGMPLSLAPSTVDIVADLDKVGQVLSSLLQETSDLVESAGQGSALEALLEKVREQNGLDFRSYKMPTIMRRLQRRLAATGSHDIEGYVEYLQEHPEEYQELASSFMINVTEFFRDEELFEYLRNTLMPALIEEARQRDNQLRIWSAGCATGEEAYSLAMLAADALGDELGRFQVRIFATDLDAEAVAFARRGLYSGSALSRVPEELVNRYFDREAGNYRINRLVRGLVVFGEHDLARRAPFPEIDLVMCRNVLIYFIAELQKRALELFAYCLRDNGRLVLGRAETVAPVSESFVPEDAQNKVFRRRRGGKNFPMPPALMKGPTPVPRAPHAPALHARSAPLSRSLSRDTQPEQSTEGGVRRNRARERQIIEHLVLGLPVGAVVVNKRYDVQLINATARQLLLIRSLATGEDLLHLIHGESAYTTLRSAIDDAFRQGAVASIEDLIIEGLTPAESLHLQIVVHPQWLEGREEFLETVLILVNDITEVVRSREGLAEELESLTTELERVQSESESETNYQKKLNRQLEQTNRQLIEENQRLLGINEELRVAMEELQITGEEAEAGAEEVETLNEELQATNEELETLNEELQSTIEELNSTNDALQARTLEVQKLARAGESERGQLLSVLNNISDAILVTDAGGTAIFHNSAYEQSFRENNVELEDEEGQPLSLELYAAETFARGEPLTMKFSATMEGGERRYFEATGEAAQSSNEDELGGGLVVIREVLGGPEPIE